MVQSQQTDGLRLLKGGEELRRATAALQTGALATPSLTSLPTQVLRRALMSVL